jgi:DNA modification methylase
VVASVVLDPFAGSGTTLYVANEEKRDAVGVELNPEYAGMIRERLSQLPIGLFD